MWKAIFLLLVTTLRVVHGQLSLHVEVKNYTSPYSYVVLQTFVGYTNSTSLALPVNGYVYTVGKPSDLVPPPFLPNSTWIAFVPRSVGHIGQSLVDAISGAGYTILLVDGSLSIDEEVTTESENVSWVIIDNATDLFAAIPISSISVKVSIKRLLDLSIISCFSYQPELIFMLPLPLTIFVVTCGCCMCACVCNRRKARRLTVGQYEIRTLEVHAPNHQTLSALEERNSRKTAAELLDMLQLAAESGKTEFGVCSVCLANVGSPEECKALPCHHYFHPVCIDEWLVEHNFTCPVCRQDPFITLAALFV